MSRPRRDRRVRLPVRRQHLRLRRRRRRSSTPSRTTPTSWWRADAMFTCSDADPAGDRRRTSHEHRASTAWSCASCSPKLHTFTFRDVAKRAGMNPYRVHPGEHPRASAPGRTPTTPRAPTGKAIAPGPRRHRSGRASPSRSSRSSVETTAAERWSSGAASPGCGPRIGLAEIGLGRRPRRAGAASSAAGCAGFGAMYPNGRRRRRAWSPSSSEP